MRRLIPVCVFAIALIPAWASASACQGADLALTSLTVASVTHGRYLTSYHLVGTVTNVGNVAQNPGAMQFVDVKQYGQRLDDRGVAPLGPGHSYTVAYVWRRAVDAGNGTTALDFRLRPVSASAQPEGACSSARADLGTLF